MTFWDRLIGAVVGRSDIVLVCAGLAAVAAVYVAPFDWGETYRSPLTVDAIPDLGDNQQVVVTEWPGRSPQDVDDQVTYPLSAALMGVAGVETVRGSSMFGLSTVYVIFEDRTDFYWARSRVLERLASLQNNSLPPGVTPTLGPDATGLGQVFWYTLEGRSPSGDTAGGFDLDELRSVQDWTVRLALQSVGGVSEVASVGGYVREYQVDIDPDALRARGVSLDDVVRAVRQSNLQVGARTLEINRVEYLVRGLGLVRSVGELEDSVVALKEGVPVRLRDVSRVGLGPAVRRGALDDGGAPAVGGVVVARYGANPREVIRGVREKIDEIAPGLPQRSLDNGTKSQVTVVPFYDRTELIDQTLQTLSTALLQQIFVTFIVVFFFLSRLSSSLVVAAMPPLGVGLTFVAMRLSGIDVNVMALGGIAIAIGTMVDVGVIFAENIRQRLDRTPSEPVSKSITVAAAEVAPAVTTSVTTTVLSFLPVLALTDADVRLFGPLAVTKTLAMLCALLLGLLLVPALASVTFRRQPVESRVVQWGGVALGTVALLWVWSPLGVGRGLLLNGGWVLAAVGLTLLAFSSVHRGYSALLRWALDRKVVVVSGVALVVGAGASTLTTFGSEHLPPFDEGAFLYMPTTMPHASMGQALEVLSGIDAAIAEIPEVERVVGKIGRVDSALDPAPISMIETVVSYRPEFGIDSNGERRRLWRDEIRSPDDIWRAVVDAAEWPGVTSAPKLMPIEARLVMLRSGMRAPMGLKLRGPDLATLERFGVEIEAVLKEVPELRGDTVFADRVVGKPYLEVEVNRQSAARYGLTVAGIQNHVEVSLGGASLTQTVEGRERYPVRVRYQREERDSIEAIGRLPIATPAGPSVPLSQVAALEFSRVPQLIRSEDTFLTSFVIFDRRSDVSEVDAVDAARSAVENALTAGVISIPEGVSYTIAGTYEDFVESRARLAWLVPVVLVLIFLVLQWQFRSFASSLMIYSSVLVSVSGGLVWLWLYGQPAFAGLLGETLSTAFHVGPVQLSVAVWVGFIALAGLATDDGVVLMTYLERRFASEPPGSVDGIREAVVEASVRRLRPCLMTTGTTLLALLPLLTSNGRGADLMLPIALPLFGGMLFELASLIVVPTLFCWRRERALVGSDETV